MGQWDGKFGTENTCVPIIVRTYIKLHLFSGML